MEGLEPIRNIGTEIRLSKREMIAAMALQGMLAADSRFNDSMLIERARILADKLLKELEKE